MKEMCKIIQKKDNPIVSGTETKKVSTPMKGGLEEAKQMCGNVMVKSIGEPLTIEETAKYFSNQNRNTDLTLNKEPGIRETVTKQSPAIPSGQNQLSQASLKLPVEKTLGNGLQSEYGGNAAYMVELPKEFIYKDGNYKTTPDGWLSFNECIVMNAIVHIDQAIRRDNGILYECRVYSNGRIQKVQIPAKEFVSGNWLRNKIVGFATACEKDQESKIIYKYLNKLVMSFNSTNVHSIEKKPGWMNMDGHMCYLTPDGPIPNCTYAVSSEFGQRFGAVENGLVGKIELILSMMNLTPSSWVAAVIVLYTIMSFSYKLFEDAGFVPKFSLFVNGPRGSYKTSLSLAMTQIEERDRPEFTLKSTSAGLETGYKKFKDAVMLVDDLAPTPEGSAKRNMQKNLEMLVRAFGDSTGIKRNYDFQKSEFQGEQYEAEGGLVITGEYVVGCESSLARSLFLPLKQGDVNVDALSALQENEKALPAFLIGYIGFLSSRYSEMVKYIKGQGMRYRKELKNRFSNPRYSEYYAQLLVTAEVLLKYGCETEQLSSEEAGRFLQIFEGHVSQAVEYNDKNLVNEAPITVLCRAIVTKITEGAYPIIPRNNIKEHCLGCILESESSYFIQQKDILAMEKSYVSDNGLPDSGYTSAALAAMLCEAGVSHPIHEGNTVRHGKKIGKVRYMELDKKKLISIANL